MKQQQTKQKSPTHMYVYTKSTTSLPSGYDVYLESGRCRVRIPHAPGFFPWSSHANDLKLALQWLPCQEPGGIGSVLGLVGSVSVYCDWVRWKVWSATSTSVWQHIKLSEQICPRDTLACCWDVEQASNQPTNTKSRFILSLYVSPYSCRPSKNMNKCKTSLNSH